MASATQFAPKADDPTEAEFAKLLGDLRARREEFQELRHIPQNIVDRFKTLGIYRGLVPEQFGGAHPEVSHRHAVVGQCGEHPGAVRQHRSERTSEAPRELERQRFGSSVEFTVLGSQQQASQPR